MDAFGIARFRDGARVAGDVAEAMIQRRAERFFRHTVFGELGFAGLLRADLAAFERPQAALDLAFRVDRETRRIAKPSCRLIERDRRSLFQLELDLADGNDRTSVGECPDFASVDRQLDMLTRLRFQNPRRAADFRLDDRPDSAERKIASIAAMLLIESSSKGASSVPFVSGN